MMTNMNMIYGVEITWFSLPVNWAERNMEVSRNCCCFCYHLYWQEGIISLPEYSEADNPLYRWLTHKVSFDYLAFMNDPWNQVLLEKLIVRSRNPQSFRETKDLLLCSQDPTTDPNLEPDESSPHPYPLSLRSFLCILCTVCMK
jgi:hypothetical protein